MASTNEKPIVEERSTEMENLKTTATRVDLSDGSDSGDHTIKRSATAGHMTKEKWLACVALGLAYTTAFQQNACTAAIVKHIDEELGPTEYYNWILSAYTISVAVSLPLAGGLSDIFGRKGFFLVGCCISLVGTIIALAAQNTPMVIVGMIFKGIGSGSQQLALAAIAEIVPNKDRGHAQAALDIVTTPWAIFGPLIGNAMVQYQRLSFRINFIIGVLLNLLTIVAIFVWYHPPKAPLIVGMTKMQRLLKLDWIGVILMAMGITLTMVGLALGGHQLPWSSGGVVAPIIIGVLSLAGLGIWEWKFAKQPFFAHELFAGRARTFSLLLVLTFVGGMSLYTAAAFWTQQAQGQFGLSPIRIGVSAIPGGAGGALGGFLGGMVIGKAKFLGSNHVLILGSSLKLISDAVFTTFTPNDLPLAMGMGFLAMFGMGFSLVALIVCVQLACDDHHIGLATLVLGSVRAIGGSVAVTIYTSIMQNTIKKDAGPRVGKAIVPLGAPMASLEPLIKMLTGGKAKLATKIPGLNQRMVSIAADTIKWSWASSFRNIYLCAIAFSTVSLIASFFIQDVSSNMTDNIAVKLTNDNSRNPQPKTVETVEAAVGEQKVGHT